MEKFLLQTVIALLMINLSQSVSDDEKTSNIREFAYQAAFLVDGDLKCGASIISEFCALTAGKNLHSHRRYSINELKFIELGHCVRLYPKGIALRVKSKFKDSDGLLMNITNFTIHPHYSESRFCNDIAVLTLPYRLEFDNLAQPVQLPDEHESVPINTESVVSGWGNRVKDEMPREMRAVKVYTVDSQTCHDNYNTSRVKFPMCSSMLCAVVPDGQDDSCYGDSVSLIALITLSEQMNIVEKIS